MNLKDLMIPYNTLSVEQKTLLLEEIRQRRVPHVKPKSRKVARKRKPRTLSELMEYANELIKNMENM